MEPAAKPSTLATWIVGIVLVVILAAIALPGLLSSQRASNERSASAILKTISSAEADFRGNDRDKNGVQDFWTASVSGLFDLVPSGEKEPLQLISRELAEADPTRPGAKVCVGYWFAAMDQDGDGLDYRQGSGKNRHPTKFAFHAYPLDRGAGRSVFFINEWNRMVRQPFDSSIRRNWWPDREFEEMTQPKFR